MVAARIALAAALLLVAIVVETVVLGPLRLPGATPDVVLVVVIAFAMATDSASGALMGFAGGVLLDVSPPADGTVGRWALVLTLAGWAAGKYRIRSEAGPLTPLLLVALIVPAALVGYAGLGLLLGDPRVSGKGIVSAVPFATLYDVVLAALLVPAIAALVRRTRRATGPAASRW
ncbi:MAG TPA: rod shape-determining protein MreD [Actinomycetes bacterium]|nr:rod shape-determining protein MreD [Actinomycetes bacterium]